MADSAIIRFIQVSLFRAYDLLVSYSKPCCSGERLAELETDEASNPSAQFIMTTAL